MDCPLLNGPRLPPGASGQGDSRDCPASTTLPSTDFVSSVAPPSASPATLGLDGAAAPLGSVTGDVVAVGVGAVAPPVAPGVPVAPPVAPMGAVVDCPTGPVAGAGFSLDGPSTATGIEADGAPVADGPSPAWPGFTGSPGGGSCTPALAPGSSTNGSKQAVTRAQLARIQGRTPVEIHFGLPRALTGPPPGRPRRGRRPCLGVLTQSAPIRRRWFRRHRTRVRHRRHWKPARSAEAA